MSTIETVTEIREATLADVIDGGTSRYAMNRHADALEAANVDGILGSYVTGAISALRRGDLLTGDSVLAAGLMAVRGE